MGPVFRAYDPDRDRLVAVKLFRLDIAPDRVHRFVAGLEKLIAAALTHPVIATPVAAGIDEANAYLATEYVAAESLDTAVRDHGPAPPGDALRVAAQLAGALDFAALVHVGHGVLHPRDVLLSSEETRLTGLGVAAALESIGFATPLRRPYAAPERIAGAPWDRRADVFSLAALMHEMLWARRPTATGVEAADSLTEIPGGDLDRLRAVFARALAENPEDRFPVALEFAEALKGAFDSRQSRGVSQEPLLPLGDPEPPLHDLELRESAPVMMELPPREVPAALVAAREPEPISVLERSRSAIWPLVLALVVGVALGFAVGYGVGISARSDAPVAAANAAPATDPDLTTSTEGRLQPDQSERPGGVPVQPIAAPAAPARNGSLVVRTTPSGARVFVNGRESGRTPLTVRDLARGTHRVRVVRDGYTTQERRVTITSARPARTMALRLTPARIPSAARTTAPVPSTPGIIGRHTGALSVESRPTGAKVYVDGRLVGSTPLSLPEVAAGEHAIRIERDGYRRWSSSVRVVADQRNRVAASLER